MKGKLKDPPCGSLCSAISRLERILILDITPLCTDFGRQYTYCSTPSTLQKTSRVSCSGVIWMSDVFLLIPSMIRNSVREDIMVPETDAPFFRSLMMASML